MGEPGQRTPGSVPPRAVGVHFVHLGNSQAHGGFVVATADVAFAAEFGAAVVSFVAAAAAAVAVVVRVAAEFAAGLCDAAAAGTGFALASAAAVTGAGL